VPSAALDRMQARASEVRMRSAVRRWQYRQRHLAAGVWYRLRRVLADAQAAYVITGEDLHRLLAEGYEPEACGMEIAPEKVLLFVDKERVNGLGSRRQIPVALGPDFLSA
jgi:hypothetical protein